MKFLTKTKSVSVICLLKPSPHLLLVTLEINIAGASKHFAVSLAEFGCFLCVYVFVRLYVLACVCLCVSALIHCTAFFNAFVSVSLPLVCCVFVQILIKCLKYFALCPSFHLTSWSSAAFFLPILPPLLLLVASPATHTSTGTGIGTSTSSTSSKPCCTTY